MAIKPYEIKELLEKQREKFLFYLQNKATWEEVMEIDNKIINAFEELINEKKC